MIFSLVGWLSRAIRIWVVAQEYSTMSSTSTGGIQRQDGDSDGTAGMYSCAPEDLAEQLGCSVEHAVR